MFNISVLQEKSIKVGDCLRILKSDVFGFLPRSHPKKLFLLHKNLVDCSLEHGEQNMKKKNFRRGTLGFFTFECEKLF